MLNANVKEDQTYSKPSEQYNSFQDDLYRRTGNFIIVADLAGARDVTQEHHSSVVRTEGGQSHRISISFTLYYISSPLGIQILSINSRLHLHSHHNHGIINPNPYRSNSRYLAYAVPKQRRAYALAAVLPLSVIPFTIFLFDGPVNQVLMREAEKQTLGDAELRELVTNWGWWNGVRCSLPMVGAVVGLWTALG